MHIYLSVSNFSFVNYIEVRCEFRGEKIVIVCGMSFALLSFRDFKGFTIEKSGN